MKGFLVHITSKRQWLEVRKLVQSSGARIPRRVLFSSIYGIYVGSNGDKLVKYPDKESAKTSGLPVISYGEFERKPVTSVLKPIDRKLYPHLSRVCKNTKEFLISMGYKTNEPAYKTEKLARMMSGVEYLLHKTGQL